MYFTHHGYTSLHSPSGKTSLNLSFLPAYLQGLGLVVLNLYSKSLIIGTIFRNKRLTLNKICQQKFVVYVDKI